MTFGTMTTPMTMYSRYSRFAALFAGALLVCCCLTARAEDAPDANKEVQAANKLFKQKQYDQALEKVNGVLATKPKDAQARFLKGLILTEQGKINDAIGIFSALTDDYPDLPEPYNNLAVLYAGQGQYEKAKASLEMAVRTHPNYATAHENLGDIYAKMASQEYNRAVQLDRNNPSPQTKLAVINQLFAKSSKPATPARAPVTQPTGASSVPAAAAPAKPVVNGNPDEVMQAVNDWATAWSSRNTKKYFACYASDFSPADGKSRAAWEAARKKSIAKTKSIHVDVSDAKVSFSDDTHASATFKQAYRDNRHKTSTYKTLMLVKSGGQWLIQEEIDEE
jgi:tetratricopeptide (TPR) repeat protein